jgi:hypothetical protein
METGKSLYQRLGGYDAIAAVANDLLPRLMNDQLLGRFWQNRAEDSIASRKAVTDRLPMRVGRWPDVLHRSRYEAVS